MAAQLTGHVVDLLPMARVSDMHVVDGLADILHVALLAGHQVHTVFGLASKRMSDFVAEASVATLELIPLSKPVAK